MSGGDNHQVGVEKCLFCAVPLPLRYSVVNGQLLILKRESEREPADDDDDIYSTSFFINEDSLVDKQLQVIFVLRNILQIPENKLFQLLKRFGGQLHPQFWISVCSPCGEAVRQFYKTLKDISVLKRRLTSISNRLKARIYNTKREERGEQVNGGIWEEIREEVLKCKEKSCVFDYEEVPVPVVTNLANVYPSHSKDTGERITSSPSPSSDENDSTGGTSSDFEPENEGKEDSNDSYSKSDNANDEEADSKNLDSKDEENKATQRQQAPYHSQPKARRQKNCLYSCHKCAAWFKKWDLLNSHLQLHKKKDGKGCTTWTCKKCGWLLRSHYLFSQHMKNHHENRKEMKKLENIKKNAVEIRYEEIPYYCDHCQMIYTKSAYFQKHFKSYHADKVDCVPCSEPDCQQKFESTQLLQLHLKWAHPNVIERESSSSSSSSPSLLDEEEMERKCEHCEDIFESKLSLDFHIASKHLDIMLTCTTCNIKHSSYSAYRKHMEMTKVHATAKPFTCELCGESYRAERGLRDHQRQKHFKELGLTPIACKECGLIVGEERTLEDHMKVVHQKQKNFSCEYCGKTFSNPRALKSHTDGYHKGHLGTTELPQGKHFRLEEKKEGDGEEENWLCDFCPVKFRKAEAVRKHLQSVHYDELKYFCEGCAKRYCAAVGLHAHRKKCPALKREGEESPFDKFQCPLCSKKFDRYDSCYKHKKRWHKDGTLQKCGRCDKIFSSSKKLLKHHMTCRHD